MLLVGQGPTALAALASLLERHSVVAVLRDAPAGDEVEQLARQHGAPVHTTATTATLESLVRATRPDCVVVSSFDRILPARLLEACRFVNVHYSPLPRYRGRANVHWAVINGEPEAAISIHELVPELDAGGVLFQERVAIGARTTATQLYERLNCLQQRELAVAVTRLLEGDVGAPQDPALVSYGCTRLPADGELDWSATTSTSDRLVRGLTWPAPGAFTFLGRRRLWVDQAVPAPDPAHWQGRVPGRVVQRSRDAGWADVLTGDGVLRLLSVRLDEGPPQPAAAVLTSVKATLGLRAADLLDELADLDRRLRALEQGGPGAASS